VLVDASVWIASGTPTEAHFEAAAALLLDPQNAVAALDLTLYEVANTLTGRFGQPRQAEILSQAILSRCAEERLVRVDAGVVRSAVQIATEHGISAYDAAYVAVARSRGWRLISIDIRDLVSKGLAVTPDAAV
jgi:predicted nucleic acid-binding protein